MRKHLIITGKLKTLDRGLVMYDEIWKEKHYKFGEVKQLQNVDWADKTSLHTGTYKLQWGEMFAGALFVLSLLCLVSLPAWVSYLV